MSTIHPINTFSSRSRVASLQNLIQFTVVKKNVIRALGDDSWIDVSPNNEFAVYWDGFRSPLPPQHPEALTRETVRQRVNDLLKVRAQQDLLDGEKRDDIEAIQHDVLDAWSVSPEASTWLSEVYRKKAIEWVCGLSEEVCDSQKKIKIISHLLRVDSPEKLRKNLAVMLGYQHALSRSEIFSHFDYYSASADASNFRNQVILLSLCVLVAHFRSLKNDDPFFEDIAKLLRKDLHALIPPVKVTGKKDGQHMDGSEIREQQDLLDGVKRDDIKMIQNKVLNAWLGSPAASAWMSEEYKKKTIAWLCSLPESVCHRENKIKIMIHLVGDDAPNQLGEQYFSQLLDLSESGLMYDSSAIRRYTRLYLREFVGSDLRYHIVMLFLLSMVVRAPSFETSGYDDVDLTLLRIFSTILRKDVRALVPDILQYRGDTLRDDEIRSALEHIDTMTRWSGGVRMNSRQMLRSISNHTQDARLGPIALNIYNRIAAEHDDKYRQYVNEGRLQPMVSDAHHEQAASDARLIDWTAVYGRVTSGLRFIVSKLRGAVRRIWWFSTKMSGRIRL